MLTYTFLIRIYAVIILLYPFLAIAEMECNYCGEWQPISRNFPGQPTVAEILNINATKISLPGCKEAAVVRKYFEEKSQDEVMRSTNIYQVIATFELQEKPICESGYIDITAGAAIEIILTVRPFLNNEEMEISVFPKKSLIDLLKSYTKEFTPTSFGGPRPSSIGSWTAIRKGYKACDEGEVYGAMLCAKADYYAANGNLNSMWNSLLKAVPKNSQKDIINRQRTWLKLIQKKCEIDNEDGWNHKWSFVLETSCKAREFNDRANQFIGLEACLKTDALKCHALTTAPN